MWGFFKASACAAVHGGLCNIGPKSVLAYVKDPGKYLRCAFVHTSCIYETTLQASKSIGHKCGRNIVGQSVHPERHYIGPYIWFRMCVPNKSILTFRLLYSDKWYLFQICKIAWCTHCEKNFWNLWGLLESQHWCSQTMNKFNLRAVSMTTWGAVSM
jgi:hypothetical protein